MSATRDTVLDEGSFRGVKNRKIVWRSWSPAGEEPVKGVLTIAHGYGEHSGRYAHVASRLTAEGYAVYAPDHNGHGRSKGKAGRVSLPAAITDLHQMIVTVSKARHPDAPQFLLGHSMGGAIALRYASAHQDRLTGLVVSAPLAAVDGGPALKAVGKLLGVIAPGVPVSRVEPRLVSRDKAVVDAYVADPLNYHGPIPARVGREFLLAAEALPQDVRQITIPTLLLWGTADRLCPPRGAEAVAANIASSDFTKRAYEGLFHEIMNEPERDQVLDDIIGWLASHLTATAAI
jgi:alpha-beta hydrolase superfamily lysophospholipase